MINHLPNAKALYIDENSIYLSKGYRVYKADKNLRNLIFDGKIVDSKYSFLSHFSRLLNRLLRIEPSSMLILENGDRVVSAKKGIFVAKKDSKKYLKTFSMLRGNKPLNICLHPNGNLYFGEYILNGRYADTERSEVHIYKSEDNGQTWSVCYTFPKNTIRHVHGIFYDKYTEKLWVTTGDRDGECIIANTDDDFKSLNIVKQGVQKYRAVSLLFYKEHIIYGTDTEHEKNYIYSIDRETNKETPLVELQGSVLMATQNQNTKEATVSTAVEPSVVNHHPYAHIWFSKDGLEWRDIYSAKKDRWSAKYFQYGRITFPQNAIQNGTITFSGHALENIDNSIIQIQTSSI